MGIGFVLRDPESSQVTGLGLRLPPRLSGKPYSRTTLTDLPLAIVPKSEAGEWLERYGESDEESASD